ncbi:universal stress protein [Sphingobacterium spiritivorum]|uniref:universal stress protein n=1 Tax=Sphingobacterium spiritivorum TaxID=258 RepID=UPI00191853E7|nr:universal stress protein [Sphingobacterium spiritivorum]QQT25496.1 universal stress protein [Sphingobacterium spiritivorum]
MKRILFPTDFSEAASNAFVYALQLAKSIDASLYILHVYELPIYSSMYAGQLDYVQQIYQSIELAQFDNYKDNVPQLHEIAKKYNLEDIEMYFVFEKGLFLDSVKRVIKRDQIDMIVMGTTGLNSANTTLIGSNTVNLIRSVSQPVFSIPRLAKFDGIKSIGFTTLFREADKKPLAEILKLADYFDAKVEVLHVKTKENEDIESLVSEWKDQFHSPRLTFSILPATSVEERVLEFIMEHNIDFLAIVKRNRNFFDRLFTSSMSQKLAYHSTIPILVIREEA